VEGSCEHDNEHPGFIKCWEVFGQLHNWQLLRKGSVPRVSECYLHHATIDNHFREYQHDSISKFKCTSDSNTTKFEPYFADNIYLKSVQFLLW
jgi:hypothetical protein